MAQSISYEVILTLIVLQRVYFFAYNLLDNKNIRTFLFFSIFLFFVSALAESNRSPFDFSEGESELVSGFNTEFSSVPFVMIFLAEYMSILFMSIVIRFLFNEDVLFIVFWAVLFIWTRATVPRFRYDQLMCAAWKSFLPFLLGLISVVLIIYDYSEEQVSYTN